MDPSIIDTGTSPGGAGAGENVESLARLAEVYHELLAEGSLESLLELIGDNLMHLIPYDTLTIYRADESQGLLFPVLARDEEYADAVLEDRPTMFGEGITGWAVEHREPVLANQAHLDPRVAFIAGTPNEPEALMSVPLIARKHIKGALNLYRSGDAAFSEHEFALAQRFADAAALAVDNADIRAALEHQAQTDALTGLYNHRYFHERLRSELTRASRSRDHVTLLMFDIDDFKKLNDVYGHALGDQVLAGLGEIVRDLVRAYDVPCRVGGEEFAVIMPSCDAGDALGLARRLRDRVAVAEYEPAGTVTLSVGVAQGPEHAMNPRELVACAEAAMMTAKARGKDQVVLYSDSESERPGVPSRSRDVRSIAHLKMLQSLAGKLNRLNDISQIADTIGRELKTLIDYHNCRVYLAEDDVLTPIVVRGAGVTDQVHAEGAPVLFGEGVSGRAASSGRPVLVADATGSQYANDAEGIGKLEESLVSVPMRYGSRVNGVLTLSKLGRGQFDEDDVRLLEVLAGQASVALENARLYDAQRREARNARALLDFADSAIRASSFHAIGNVAVRAIAAATGAARVSLWLREADEPGFSCHAHEGYVGRPETLALITTHVTPDDASALLSGRRQPFVLGSTDGEPATAIAPLPSGDGVDGWLTVADPEPAGVFSDETLRLLEGFAYQVSIAMQKAFHYHRQKEAADTASALLDFTRQLASAVSTDEVLTQTVELAARIVGSPRTGVWLQDAATGDMVIEATWGLSAHDRAYAAQARVTSEQVGNAFDRRDPFILTARHLEDLGMGDLSTGLSYAVAPMHLEGGRLGLITVGAPALGDYRFSERKLRLLSGIADQAKLALNNAIGFETLESTFVSTVEALANALEAKDEYTSSHTRSIVDMSREVGLALGLESPQLKRLEMGALFHDIGKIGIPSSILQKPGPLTDEEREIMKTHPELGERILEPIERLGEVRPIVRACHEHFDGSGYPDRKAADEIPLEARIILVCDAFHAMTTDRPYRARLPVIEAMRRLRQAAGTQFDPQVVATFLKLLDEDPSFALSA